LAGDLSVPNPLAVFMDFANAVKGHAMKLARRIHQSKRIRVILSKLHFPEEDPDDPAFHTVEIAQLEISAGILRVPADTVQQFVNWRHGPPPISIPALYLAG